MNETSQELDVLFAKHVCGWHIGNKPGEYEGYWYNQEGYVVNVGLVPVEFSRSASEVIPWLERSPFDVEINYSNTCSMWYVHLLGRFNSGKKFDGEADTFARAAVIALLWANGGKV